MTDFGKLCFTRTETPDTGIAFMFPEIYNAQFAFLCWARLYIIFRPLSYAFPLPVLPFRAVLLFLSTIWQLQLLTSYRFAIFLIICLPHLFKQFKKPSFHCCRKNVQEQNFSSKRDNFTTLLGNNSSSWKKCSLPNFCKCQTKDVHIGVPCHGQSGWLQRTNPEGKLLIRASAQSIEDLVFFNAALSVDS